uniref:EGF-like domain-containing protein n=1 Tax=Clastoptera arizonana TaxID=38151 RepID=A0A1B6DGW2_9HEMI
MEFLHLYLFFQLNLVNKFVLVCQGCDPGQERHGCRIQQGRCFCGYGCYSEYRYSSKEECRKALKGRQNDACQRIPCLHNGACTQTSQDQGYKCHCEGTGYYGSCCQHACPTPGALNPGARFPHECVVI